MMAPVMPVVHMNGTSMESLLEQRETVYTALTTALDAFREVSPNPRDYYVGVPGLFEQAVAQYNRRTATLQALRDEIEEEVGLLDTMKQERAARRAW